MSLVFGRIYIWLWFGQAFSFGYGNGAPWWYFIAWFTSMIAWGIAEWQFDG